MSSFEIRQGDVLDRLREMPDESVHMVCTSPPYWGLRSYGVEGQLGLEATPDEFVANMVEVFAEVKRVLRRDGTCWLNIGDSYAGGGSGRNDIGNLIEGRVTRVQQVGSEYKANPVPPGLKPKDLCMIPARLALALQADGWWIRSEITWCKRAPMPESVRDRPTSATEKIYLLTKSDRYFYDADAVREITGREADPVWYEARKARVKGWTGDDATGKMARQDATARRGDNNNFNHPLGRNLWNYWLLSPDPYPEAHFATFPREIPRRAILAGTSERGVCGACGAPWKRVTERIREHGLAEIAFPKTQDLDKQNGHKRLHQRIKAARDAGEPHDNPLGGTVTTGWAAACPCDAPTVPATVLDPFAGAGTTLLVAVQHGRRGLGIELNPDYISMALKRIHREGAPLFAWADGQQNGSTPQAVIK